MQTYLIDGYNLLKSPAFRFPLHLDFEGQRQHLMRILNSYAQSKNISVILIFDGAAVKSSSTIRYHRIQTIYSRSEEDADSLIKSRIRREKHPGNLIVVTSDRAIRFTARDHGVHSLSSEEFCNLLHGYTESENIATSENLPEEKFNPNIKDEDIEYWKRLFEQDGENE